MIILLIEINIKLVVGQWGFGGVFGIQLKQLVLNDNYIRSGAGLVDYSHNCLSRHACCKSTCIECISNNVTR